MLHESVSPVLWKFCNQIPLASKVKFPGGSQPLCQIPRLEDLLWALELLQQLENFFGIIVLQFVGHLLSSSIVGLMVTSSKRTFTTHHAFQDCCCLENPHGRPLLTHAFTGDPQPVTSRSGSVSCEGHCSFPWVLVHTKFCLCPPRFIKSHWPIRVRFPGGSQSLCQIPRLGNLLWALELLQQCYD